MADGNEDARADDLPGPAFENYEAMELACPAERSGHVAVSDGRHMFVWGGYKVSGARRGGLRFRGATVAALVPSGEHLPSLPPWTPRGSWVVVTALLTYESAYAPRPRRCCLWSDQSQAVLCGLSSG